ncbi:MAG TPA: hypothetical protein HPP80_09430 [Rhodospirillaceae bacterium]|nr:hypothetical protein [Rhodospirillaceae bacterium]
MLAIALALHTLASVVWVGGIFFVFVVLRPNLASLAPEIALPLWSRLLGRFFNWVWASILVILVTGYGVILFGYEGFNALGPHIRIMQVSGLLMIGLFVLMWSMPWQRFCQAVGAEDWPAALSAMKRMRQVVVINLILGFFTTAIGATGGFWSY